MWIVLRSFDSPDSLLVTSSRHNRKTLVCVLAESWWPRAGTWYSLGNIDKLWGQFNGEYKPHGPYSCCSKNEIKAPTPSVTVLVWTLPSCWKLSSPCLPHYKYFETFFVWLVCRSLFPHKQLYIYVLEKMPSAE